MTPGSGRRKPRRGSEYGLLLEDVAGIIEEARRSAVRAVNAAMTAAYWLIGRRIVEVEQGGTTRAVYGEALLKELSADLTMRYGRGFGVDNLQRFRLFYLEYPQDQIYATGSRRLSGGQLVAKHATVSRISEVFPLPWSSYVRLLSVKNLHARRFYEAEALRGGWSVRQLDRQINSQFYERTAMSRNKAAMLAKGQKKQAGDLVSPEEAIKDPCLLEFLDLKDEYSESQLEEALIRHLETFLLELGDDFCFVGRQRRLRIGNAWYRVDLLFFHRSLRCMVVIDLKIGQFNHADAGQMHMYLSYARKHWVREGENPPVGVILCAQKDEAVAEYALDELPTKVMAAEYRTTLPDEDALAAEIERTREALEGGRLLEGGKRRTRSFATKNARRRKQKEHKKSPAKTRGSRVAKRKGKK